MTDLLADAAPWKALAEPSGAELLALAAQLDPKQVRDVVKLRARFPELHVRVALELLEARRRASRRLEASETLIADIAGVEQASRASVAAWKAKQFAIRGSKRVFDLCCGIGGDARHLARLVETIGVDLLPARVFMTERYAGCATLRGDVVTRAVASEYVHLDPSRREDEKSRGGARRAHFLDEMRPPGETIERVMREAKGGALKLSPGIDLRELPWRDRCEIELVSDGGSLIQAVLWFGEGFCQPGRLRATRLPEEISVSSDDISMLQQGDGTPKRYLYVADAALERARIVASAMATVEGGEDVSELHPGLGLLTSDACIESPWLERYEVIASLPWRLSKVREWLIANDGGAVEVKTRGGAIDALATQIELNGTGRTPYVVFGLRVGKPVVAIVARRPDAPAGRAANEQMGHAPGS